MSHKDYGDHSSDEITNIRWERTGIGYQEHEELRGVDHYGRVHILDSRGPNGDPNHPPVGMGEQVYQGFENNTGYHSWKEKYHLVQKSFPGYFAPLPDDVRLL